MFQPKTRMQLQEYVKSLLPLTLGADGAAAGSGLIIHDSANLMDSFPNDDQSMVLFVLKHHSTPDGDYRFTAYSQLQPYDESQIAWLALIKRRPVLDMEQPFGQQLQLVNLPCGVIYETLHSYVRNAFTPFFNMSMMTGAASNGVSSAGAVGGERSDKLVAKKKLAELELSLLHLQQNVEIPQVALTIHPIIQRAAASAKTAGKRLSLEFVDEITLADPAFLNQLQADVNGWIREIQKVTKLTREVASGTASQEINFWLALERELERVEQQLRSDQVNLVMDVLKHAKRFHATMSFLADTGLKDAVDTAQKYNILMKDFPLGELLSSADLQKIQEALIGIFGHVNKKLRLSPYPVKRSLDLMEAISLDLNDQLIRLLGSRKLMHLDYQEFERLMAQLNQVFEVWDEQLKDFTNVAREIVRKRSEKFIPIKVVTAHSRLQERINFIWNFRRQHYQLHDTIVKVSDDGATIAVKDIDDAYECVRNINVLDISEDGTEIWVAGESSYNSRVSRVENQITARLRDLLAAARNASEMFRVFSRYNALFIRPKIRGAIQEYQTQLIENVKQDITKLHDKFKMQYQHSAACKMSAVRDIPPVAGAIIWGMIFFVVGKLIFSILCFS